MATIYGVAESPQEAQVTGTGMQEPEMTLSAAGMAEMQEQRRVSVENQQRAWLKQRNQNRENLDKALLDFDNWNTDLEDEVKKRRAIRLTMRNEFGIRTANTLDYEMRLAEVSEKMFGERVDNDEAFFAKLVESAQGRKERAEYEQEIRKRAVRSMSGLSFDDSNEAKLETAADWKVLNDHKERVREKYGHVLKEASDLHIAAMTDKLSFTKVSNAIKDLDDEEVRDLFEAVALFANVQNVPEGKADAWENFKKHASRDSRSIGGSMLRGVGMFLEEMSHSTLAGDDFVLAEYDSEEEMEAEHERMNRVEGMLAEVDRIRDQLNPIPHLTEEDTLMRNVEDGVNAIPGVGLSIASGMVPYAGPVAMYGMLERSAYQDMYMRAVDSGVDRAQAMDVAGSTSQVVGAVQLLPEMVGLKVMKGKLPAMSQFIDKAPKFMQGRVGRLVTGTVVRASGETATEEIEAIIGEFGHGLAQAADADMPGMDWQTHWGNFADRNITTFIATLPFGGGGAIHNDVSVTKRAQAAREADTDLLLASGFDAQKVEAFKVAEGQAAQNVAYTEMVESRDVTRKGIKEAATRYEQTLQQREKEVQKAQELGVLPSFRVRSGSDAVEVYLADTGEVIGTAESEREAAKMAFEHAGMQERDAQDQFDYMVSQLEGAVLDAKENDGDSVTEVRTDKLVTTDDAEVIAQQTQQERERTQAQLDLLGINRGVFFGSNKDLWEGDQRTTITELNKGATLLTQVHERGHAYFRRALETGSLTEQQAWNFFKQIDKALEGKTGKKGEDLRFLKGREEMTFEAIDEAVAEFQEVMLLRTRNGKKSKMRELLNKNLTAFVRANVPGAKVFKGLVDGMRKFFEVALGRHMHIKKAIREGVIDESMIEAYRAKLQGTTEQEQYDADVQQEAREIFGEYMARGEAFSLGRVPVKLGDAVIGHRLAANEHVDYEAAKSGDVEAAYRLAKDLVTPEFIERIKKQTKDASDIVPVIAIEESGQNQIPHAVAKRVATEMDLSFEDGIVKVSRENRSNLSGLDRVFTRVEFDGEVKPSAHYLLADDTLTQGGALRDLADHIVRGGGEVAGVVALTGKEFSAKLDPDAEAIDRVRARIGDLEESFRNATGYGFDELTASEARTLTNWKPLDSIRDRILAEERKRGNSETRRTSRDGEEGLGFSIGNSAMLDDLAGSPILRAKRPETKVAFMQKIVEKLHDLKRDKDEVTYAFGKVGTKDALVDPRAKKSLRKERDMRQAILEDEYTGEAIAHLESLEESGVTKVREMPVHSYLADPNSNLKGSLISMTELKRQGRLENVKPEYDGAAGLGRGLYGGTMTPDQAAQELYNEGLIKEPTPDAMWDALSSEKQSVIDISAAKKAVTDGKAKARKEAADWLKDAEAKQKRDHDPMARLQRALKTLDAIISVLPVEVRGKVGGHTTLAKIKSDEKRLEYLHTKLEKVDQVLDKWIADETRKQIDKLFKKAAVKKNKKGIPKAKLAADFTDEIRAIEKLSKLSKKEVEAKTQELMDLITQFQQEPEGDAEVDRLTEELVQLLAFGDLAGKSAAESISAFQNIQSVYNTGLMVRESYEEEFKAEVDELKSIVNHDVTGGKGKMDDQAAKRRADNNKKLAGLSKFHRQNISFEWLLNGLARENLEVGTMESETHGRLAAMVHIATHAEKRANMASEARYSEEMSRIFGGVKGLKLSKKIDSFTQETDATGVFKDEYGANGAVTNGKLRASNVRALIENKADREALGLSKAAYRAAVTQYKEMQKAAKDGVVKDNAWVHYQHANKGESKEMRLSQDQAINLTMLWMQNDLRESMEREGFTAETMDQMEAFLTDEAKQVRAFLRAEYDANYDTLNEVFKVMMGVNLPKHEFYSPAVRKAQGNIKEMEVDSRGNSAMSTSPDFLISRVKNFAQVDQTVGALSIYARHTAQSNHYIHWAEPIKKLRSIFGDVEVKKNVKDYAGDSMLSVLMERVEWMADGGNRKATHMLWLDNMRQAFTYSALAYNWGVAVKQLTSIPAYAWDMGLGNFGKYSLKFMKNPIQNMKMIWELDYTQARFKEGYERDVIDGLRGDGGMVKRMLQTGMMFGKIGDIVPVMSGGWMAYQKAYDQAKADGATDAQAKEIATLEFEMSTDRAQQAGDLKDLSSFQAGGSLFKLFTMFKTSPRQYYANTYESLLDAKAGKKGAKKEFARRFFIGQIVLPLTFQFVTDLLKSPFNDDDEEDFSPKDYVRAMLLGPLNGLFIAGDFAEQAMSGAADTTLWSKILPVYTGGEKIAHGLNDMFYGDFGEGVDDLARGVGKFTATPFTFYDIIRREIDRMKLLEE